MSGSASLVRVFTAEDRAYAHALLEIEARRRIVAELQAQLADLTHNLNRFAAEAQIRFASVFAELDYVRRAIGLAGQSAAVESAMTGRENLELIGRLFGHDSRQARASAGVVLELLGLGDSADRLARTYSGGMRRKLDLGASLVGAPELLLLDEPTTGLDPRSRNDLWDAIRDLVAAGTDVLLTTQYLDEADHLANRIAIIDHGKVIAEGTPDELKSMAGDDVIEVHVAHLDDVDRAIEVLAPMSTGQPRVDRPTRSVAIPVDKGSARLLEAVRTMDTLGLEVSDIGLRRATLDEVFLSLTGRTAEAAPESHADEDRPRRGRKAAKAAAEESMR